MINKTTSSSLLKFLKIDCSSKSENTGKPVAVPLQPQHIEDASHLLVKSFMGTNHLYKNLDLDYDKFIAYMRNKCQNAVKMVNKYNDYPMSWVLLNDGKVVGAMIMSELTTYVNKLRYIQSGIKQFDAYLNFNRSFWDELDFTQYKEGEAVYADMMGINPEDANKGYAFLLANTIYSEGLKKMNYFIGRITNQLMLKLVINFLHAKIIRQFKMVVSGETNSFWMVEINFLKIRNSQKGNEKSKL